MMMQRTNCVVRTDKVHTVKSVVLFALFYILFFIQIFTPG